MIPDCSKDSFCKWPLTRQIIDNLSPLYNDISILEILEIGLVNIEYMYAFVERYAEKAIRILIKNEITGLKGERICYL